MERQHSCQGGLPRPGRVRCQRRSRRRRSSGSWWARVGGHGARQPASQAPMRSRRREILAGETAALGIGKRSVVSGSS
jgi:hypothetical protein